MRLLTFWTEAGGLLRLGAKTGAGVVDVERAASARRPQGPAVPTTFDALLSGQSAARAALAELVDRAASQPEPAWILDEDGLEFGPCLPNPGKIICVGLNYHRYAAETGAALPETPVLFAKYNNSLAAAGEAIPLPANAEQYDYEVELAVVIGRRARYVGEAEALDYVFGYCNANDLGARDLQNRTSQWLLGKALDKFLPIGPYLVTSDEISDPQNLGLRCWVNGTLRQDSNTSDMVFTVAQLISYISQYLTLEPGDLLSTGTPEGVVLTMKEKVWLKPGDEVTVEVEKLGRLTNVMRSEVDQSQY